MLAFLSILRREVRPMIALAVPVVVAELGWITMGIVDIVMVGHLGPEAIGAVGVGSMLFMALAVFGIGMLLGLDTFVSHAFGRGHVHECHRWLFHGLVLGLVLTVPLTLAAQVGTATVHVWGFNESVIPLLVPYLRIVSWSALPLFVYASCRRYLQAMGVVRPVMLTLVSANVINAAVNWLLISGNLGAPALGVNGAGWATCVSRAYLAVVLAAIIVVQDARRPSGLWAAARPIEVARLSRLARLGLPAALQVTMEVGVFAAATAMAGTLAAVSLAAHQIALNIASFTFMVPLGVASAGAVRVGHAVGRLDPDGAHRSGWTAVFLGTGFMAAAAATFVVAPRLLLGLFTTDAAVLALGTSLLMVAAYFQLFDGLQGVLTGVLRGLGDTRTPMVSNLAGHWFFGLPAGWVLCFVIDVGVVGLWIGLSAGLTIVALVLVAVWRRRIQAFRREAGATR